METNPLYKAMDKNNKINENLSVQCLIIQKAADTQVKTTDNKEFAF